MLPIIDSSSRALSVDDRFPFAISDLFSIVNTLLHG